MNIYVITAGSYSDYRIYGVTTDPERAEDMKQKVTAWCRYDTAKIEEYEDGVFDNSLIDDIQPHQYWKVTLYPGRPITPISYMDKAGYPLQVYEERHKGSWKQNERGFYGREVTQCYIVDHIEAEDEEHAAKIAIDEATKRRARNDGV